MTSGGANKLSAIDLGLIVETYSHLSNKRDVTLTDFGKFHPAQNKNPPCTQSHYKEVPRWEILMEQELRSGLDMGQIANFPAFIASKYFDL